jgi:hypothetical protein
MGASFNQFRNRIWGPFLRDMVDLSVVASSIMGGGGGLIFIYSYSQTIKNRFPIRN